jgi:hypothetical protein
MATQAVLAETIAPADVAVLAAAAERDAIAFVEANRIDVVDLATLERAVGIRRAIGEKTAAIAEALKKPKAWAYGLHRWFCDLENGARRPLEELDAYERSQITAFKAEQDRLRAARERELAEVRRREEQDRAASVAAAFEIGGEPELAAAVLEEAITAPAPIVVLADETTAIEGLHFRRKYRWRFLRSEARALELLPRAFLAVDTRKLDKYADAMKGAGAVPGIEFYHEDIPIR